MRKFVAEIDRDPVWAEHEYRPSAAGPTSTVPDCSTNDDSANRINGQLLFYHIKKA